ncbi:MAG: TSUP family transporter, partial [Vulcanimicrobiaceae bacterium]
GLAAGVLGGISSQYGPPLGIYLLALGVPKDTFISTMAVTLGIGAVALLFSLISFHVLHAHEMLYSALAVIPAFLGLVLGELARNRFSQKTFRKAVLLILFVTAAFLIRRGLHG